MNATRKNLLFLCTGNSCRSQMAEGWARHLGGELVSVGSAGIEAHGKNPLAIAVMAEAGIDISGQESTRLSDAMLNGADLLITVCGHAADNCPVVPLQVRKEHWPLEDPAQATGSKEEILDVFRNSRDEIHLRVAELLERLDD